MLGLPKSTEVNKQLTKKAIYAKFQMPNAEKEKIDADISRISIVNEVSEARTNIKAGKNVKSFFVLNVALKKKKFSEANIVKLSKLIPQNILMVLSFEDEAKLAVNHVKLIQSEWLSKEELDVQLRGLDLDQVWENIIVQIGNIKVNEGNSLEEQIQQNEQTEKIKKEIEKLEKEARSEKQPKKKFEIVQKINKLEKYLEDISYGQIENANS